MSLFSDARHTFPIIPEDDLNGIVETLPFLLACQELVPFLDSLGSTAFAPVKSDLNGNIKRLMDKYKSDPTEFSTLQSIIENEISQNIHTGKYSCTTGLLWLKRGLLFIYLFLENVVKGEQDLVKCCYTAYEDSLKRYHNWFVRGIVTVAIHAAPYYSDFMSGLKKDKTLSDDQVLHHISTCISALKTNIDAIDKYFVIKGFNFD